MIECPATALYCRPDSKRRERRGGSNLQIKSQAGAFCEPTAYGQLCGINLTHF